MSEETREERKTCPNCGRVYKHKPYEIQVTTFVSIYGYQCCYKCLEEFVRWAFDQAHLDGLWNVEKTKGVRNAICNKRRDD